ncbi:MAG: DUF1232 domain-containing protein [Solirubrobacterales bacterium]|nr:DUF1232 domain-containing protein [Solirubrobacterales bacterium]
MLVDALIAIVISLTVVWLVIALVLVVKRPDRETIAAVAKLPGELVSMIRTLLREDQLPRAARIRLWILLGYLISPIDLVPDFIPVIGYADDVIVTAILLRGTARSVGADALREAWPGSSDNLKAILRLCGISDRS